MTEEDDRSAAATVSAAATASAVNVKLPPFCPADSEVWFAQVETQFTTRGITAQKTRFDYVVASHGPEFATEVRDLIPKPPTVRPYDTLKAQLIKRTAASEQRKLQQLFNAEELGDRKSTQPLRRMQQLLGDTTGTPDELFFKRLPSNVRMVLASTDESLTLDKLAELADKVMEVAIPSVAAIHTPQPVTEVTQLREKVARLSELVQSLLTQPRRRNSSKNRRSPSPVRPRPHTDSALCWYHQKFGDAAHCIMTNKNMCAGQ